MTRQCFDRLATSSRSGSLQTTQDAVQTIEQKVPAEAAKELIERQLFDLQGTLQTTLDTLQTTLNTLATTSEHKAPAEAAKDSIRVDPSMAQGDLQTSRDSDRQKSSKSTHQQQPSASAQVDAPPCRKCGITTSTLIVRDDNLKGNAGRPYWKCVPCDEYHASRTTAAIFTAIRNAIAAYQANCRSQDLIRFIQESFIMFASEERVGSMTFLPMHRKSKCVLTKIFLVCW